MAKKIFHCGSDAHNKFWEYEIIGNDVKVFWGRCGLDGQSKTHTFGNSSARDEFIADKVAEKLKKGYKEINQQKKQEETETAQDLGTQYKISRIEWVDRKNKDLPILINYDPNRFVYIEILNSWSKEVVRLLLSKNETYKIDGISESNRVITCGSIYATMNGFAGAVRRYLQRLAKKVQDVVVKFAAIGVRKLSLDDEDDNIVTTAASDLSDLVGDSGASNQVIRRFAALGQRV